jgi:hypothetical protein
LTGARKRVMKMMLEVGTVTWMALIIALMFIYFGFGFYGARRRK